MLAQHEAGIGCPVKAALTHPQRIEGHHGGNHWIALQHFAQNGGVADAVLQAVDHRVLVGMPGDFLRRAACIGAFDGQQNDIATGHGIGRQRIGDLIGRNGLMASVEVGNGEPVLGDFRADLLAADQNNIIAPRQQRAADQAADRSCPEYRYAHATSSLLLADLLSTVASTRVASVAQFRHATNRIQPMTLRIHTPLAALMALFLAATVSAYAEEESVEEVRADADRIHELLAGAKAVGDGFEQTFGDPRGHESAPTSYWQGNQGSFGRWKVVNGQYCSQWPPNDSWSCYDVFWSAQEGATWIIWVASGGERYVAQLKP